MIYLYEPNINKKSMTRVQETLEKNWLSGNTPIVREFESQFADFIGVKYALACSSGTTALHLANIVLNIKKDDEVIMPSMSYIASANSVKYQHAQPVFVDIDMSTWQMDVNLIQSKITKKTKAIMPVHLYGGIPNLSEIEKIANKNNLNIIHDSAESLGAKYSKKHAASYKDVAIHSFFPNKIITTGEGGMLLTNNKDIYEMAKLYSSQGLSGNEEYKHSVIGYNYRMTSLSAALGLEQIIDIDLNVEKKLEILNYYKLKFKDNEIVFQENESNVESANWLVAILLSEKVDIRELQKYLYKNDVETRRIFKPIHSQDPYMETNNQSEYKNSNFLYNNGICLPSYPDLTKKQIDFISQLIIDFIM